MKSEKLYLAALFHDIGKLIERSKRFENKKVNQSNEDIKYSHARYTSFFLKEYLNSADWIKDDKEKLWELASFHHNPKSFEGRVIQFADWLASSERVEDEQNTTRYNHVQLRSIFGTLFENKTVEYYKLDNLSFDNLIPINPNPESTKHNYLSLSNDMIENFKRLRDKEDLLFYLEKYLSFVPAQTTGNDPDISLFDHCKLTAAIAVCLANEIENGQLNDDRLKKYLKVYNTEKLQDEHFILINADLSGIQNYIFNIPSKGAAKSLKGRSIYLILLMESICNYIIDKLQLEKANIIYNGGGNFYILAPKNAESKISELRRDINKILFNHHKGKLICNIGFTTIKLYEFKDFKNVWRNASEATSKQKQKKISDFWDEDYENIFEPKNLILDGKYCSVCHSTKNVKEKKVEDGLQKICSLCESFESLTDSVFNAKTMDFEKIDDNESFISYKTILSNFGYNITYSNIEAKKYTQYTLNSFGNDRTLKWKIGAFNLPVNENGNRKSFDEISGNNGKLAYFKLDVDNLGKMFMQGLDNPSLSRMATLSRMIRLFFEAYLPYLIKKENLENELYVVFSGGDDTFLIGEINTVLNFSFVLRKHFRKYVSDNPKLTFSAGIGIFGAKHPIIKATQITENYLEMAKELVYLDEEEATKDKVTILNEVFTWKEFNYILRLKDKIVNIVENSSESRAILQKIINTTKGWKPILDAAQKGKVNTQKIWKLRYHLRNVTKSNKDEIIKIYEDMWLHDLYENTKIRNHQIITVATKLADLQTRKK